MSAPFTRSELEAEIVLAECVIRTGHWNGYRLDWEQAAWWLRYLSDLRSELEVIEHPELYAPLPATEQKAA